MNRILMRSVCLLLRRLLVSALQGKMADEQTQSSSNYARPW